MRTQSPSSYAMSSSSFDDGNNILPSAATTGLCSNLSSSSFGIGGGDSSSSSSSSSTFSLGPCDNYKCPSGTASSSALSAPITIPTQEASQSSPFYPSTFGGLASVFEPNMNVGSSIPGTPEPFLSTSLPPAASLLPPSIQKQLCQNLFDNQNTAEENAKWMPMQRDVQHYLMTGENPENLAPGWKEFGHRGSI